MSVLDLPKMLKMKQVCEVLNASESTVERLKASGQLPRHVVIGNVHRWDRDELVAWLEAGAPVRKVWEAMKKQQPKR